MGNPIADFIYQYYQKPIIEHSGYNVVNTLTYALIALLGIYVLWLAFQRFKIRVDRPFILGVLTFVLFGSTVRIITDLSDHPNLWAGFPSISPLHAWVYNSGIYAYTSYLIETPGIYIITAVLLVAALAVLHWGRRPGYLPYVGLALWFPHFLVILPFLGRYALHVVPVALLAALPAYYVHRKYQNPVLTLTQASHSFDGAATFYAIDIFSKFGGISYGEQHVVGGFIGQLFGTFFAFYLAKIALAYLIVDTLAKEKADENYKNYIALVVMIIGFAPGLRDVLRMMAGV